MKKLLNYILLAILFSSVLSCNRQLNLAPPDQLPTEDAINDMSGLTAATQGMYAGMRDIRYYGRSFLIMPELMGDNVYLTVDNSNRYLSSYRFNWITTDADVADVWNDIYINILRDNNIINLGIKVPTVSDEEEQEKNNMIGQAYFLRALEHFDLVRLYAQPYINGNGSQLGVPYITAGEIGTPKRNSVGEVYNFVIGDLKKADSLMDGDDSDPYYANSNAVAALLSRVYLYMGDNNNAIKEASSIIDGGSYKIYDAKNASGYADFFNTPGTTEEIFTLRFLSNESTGSEDLGDMYNQSGYGDIRVSPGFINSFDNADVRKSAFIIPFPGSAGEFANRKFSGQDGIAGLYSPKILRISEVYLNRAEAYAKLKNYAAAIKDINAIRVNRGLSDLGTVKDEDVLDSVLTERRKELMFEGQRYFDLLRNGIDINRTDCGNPKVLSSSPCQILYKSDQSIVPIPQRERDANPNMEQNPGYTGG